MVVGVSIARSCEGAGSSARFVADGMGYMIHGLGCVPFIEHLTKR